MRKTSPIRTKLARRLKLGSLRLVGEKQVESSGIMGQVNKRRRIHSTYKEAQMTNIYLLVITALLMFLTFQIPF